MINSEKRGLINLDVEPTLLSAVKKIADDKGLSVDDVLNDALDFYIKKNKNSLVMSRKCGLINRRRGFNKPIRAK